MFNFKVRTISSTELVGPIQHVNITVISDRPSWTPHQCSSRQWSRAFCYTCVAVYLSGKESSDDSSVSNELDSGLPQFQPTCSVDPPVINDAVISASPSDAFIECVTVQSPAYQCEVVIPADGSPIPLASPTATAAGVGSPLGRSAGLTYADAWDKVSRSPFTTFTTDRVNPLTTIAEILNWDLTTTSDSLVASSSSSNITSSSVVVQSSLLNADSLEKMHISQSLVDDVAKSSISTSTCSVSLNCHLSASSTSPLRSASEPRQDCTGPTRSLWDAGWLTTEQGEKPAELGVATTESGRATDPCPSAISITSAGRQPPLRLILVKTVGTDNIWSSRPAFTIDPSSSELPPRTKVSRGQRDVCTSLSESVLSDFSRWTELNCLQHGGDRLSARRNIHTVVRLSFSNY